MKEFKFRDKNAAWFVYRRIQNIYRSQGIPTTENVGISGSVVLVGDNTLDTFEEITGKLGAKYKVF